MLKICIGSAPGLNPHLLEILLWQIKRGIKQKQNILLKRKIMAVVVAKWSAWLTNASTIMHRILLKSEIFVAQKRLLHRQKENTINSKAPKQLELVF